MRLLKLVLCCQLAVLLGKAESPASTPPMGWNSWDSYGLTVTEDEFKANATYLATNLKQFGWEYAVVDEGWYLRNPDAKAGSFQFVVSAYGLYLPALQRFPSAQQRAGFRALADWTHAQGLKFGIHIIRGIPREAVQHNLAIERSPYRAAAAADTSDTCPWNSDNYGVKANAAGQAYYDSLARLYASWGVDFLKVDCIASHPYKPDEIDMIDAAIRKTGRPIVLSLSPGPAPIENAAEFVSHAQMWRISDDVWDHWAHDPAINFSQGVAEQFPVAARWAAFGKDGHWPDADMLPLGFLGPRPGNGAARHTKLTSDEQKTMMTAWSIFRSPLILGANLTQADPALLSLLTNPEVIAVNQNGTAQEQARSDAATVVWRSRSGDGSKMNLAVFNMAENVRTLDESWSSLGISAGSHAVRDLWLRKELGKLRGLTCTLPAHGSALFQISLQ